MALTTPSIMMTGNVFTPFENIDITFTVIGGSQVTKNKLSVSRTSDNVEVFNDTTPDNYFKLDHIIPSGTLITNTVYKVKVQTYDSAGNISLWSNYITITIQNSPTIDITNIQDGSTYNNQNLIVNGSYTQPNDLLKTYQYFLYDSSKNLLAESSILYDGLLTYTFGQLTNNTKYYVTLITTSQAGMTTQLQKSFTTEYIAPTFSSLLTLSNNKDNARVDLQIVAIRTIGHIKSGTVTSDGEYVDCSQGIVQFDDQSNHGLNFKYNDGNWQMQIWLKGLIDQYTPINGVLEGTLIAQLFGDNGVMCKLEYYNGMFHYYKFITVNNQYSLISHYVSNVINATSDDVVYLFVNCQNDRIGMSTQIIN